MLSQCLLILLHDHGSLLMNRMWWSVCLVFVIFLLPMHRVVPPTHLQSDGLVPPLPQWLWLSPDKVVYGLRRISLGTSALIDRLITSQVSLQWRIVSSSKYPTPLNPYSSHPSDRWLIPTSIRPTPPQKLLLPLMWYAESTYAQSSPPTCTS